MYSSFSQSASKKLLILIFYDLNTICLKFRLVDPGLQTICFKNDFRFSRNKKF